MPGVVFVLDDEVGVCAVGDRREEDGERQQVKHPTLASLRANDDHNRDCEDHQIRHRVQQRHAERGRVLAICLVDAVEDQDPRQQKQAQGDRDGVEQHAQP